MFNPNDITFEYDKSMIGKAYLKDLHIYIVVGYDFFKKTYLLRTTDTNSYYSGIYLEATEERMKNIKPLPRLIEEIEKEIEKNNVFEEAYNHLVLSIRMSEHKNISAARILNRLKETHDNVRDIKAILCLKGLKEEERKFYERELLKASKGFRRAKKLLYRYLSKQSAEIILNYYEENNYKNVIITKWKMDKLKELIETIKEIKGDK